MGNKKIFITFDVIMIVSVIIAAASAIIVLFDINGCKGLIPLIFGFSTIYFLFNILTDIAKITPKKKFNFSISKGAFFILSTVATILSVYVYWV